MKMTDVIPRRAVLCIERESAARAAVGLALGDYDVVFTSDAFETIRSMNVRAFDAFVIDFWLPDWSGPQLCRSIRELDPHCPVIFRSAAGADLCRQRALRAGASMYFVKPVSSEALSATLADLIGRADAASLRAKASMERAVQAELARWQPRLSASRGRDEASMQSLERTARSRAHEAFVSAGGTRAHFERWWPHVMGSARANNRAVAASSG
jgi:DNA-binding response OmpR family regulator